MLQTTDQDTSDSDSKDGILRDGERIYTPMLAMDSKTSGASIADRDAARAAHREYVRGITDGWRTTPDTTPTTHPHESKPGGGVRAHDGGKTPHEVYCDNLRDAWKGCK